MNLNKIHHNTL